MVALLLPALATAQSYTDRNLSIAPSARDGSRPIVILSPVQPATPPAATPDIPRQGPVGSYASDAPGPDLRAKNADYTTQFSVVGQVPAGATIRKVAWRYGVKNKPPGFEAVLCWQDAGTCWTISDAASGSTDFFNGRDALRPFMLIYRVRGSGRLPGGEIRGAMNQVIVTYDIPH